MKQQLPSESATAQLGNYTVCFGQLLGKGTTGTVYRGYQNSSKIQVAVKVIELSTIKDDATRSLLQNEKNALRTIKDPNVVQLLDIVQRDGRCYIVMELCEGHTLAEVISRKGRLTEEEAMKIFRKILSGCLTITQNCIIHRDLKPTNILISSTFEPKVIDFGFCEVIQSKKVMRTFNVGSPSYMAPQAYLRTLYSEKSDSWSLGMILFEMLHGRTLDQGHKISEYFQLLKNNPNYLNQFSGNWNSNVKQILQKSLKYQTQERMSISGMKYLADVYHIRSKKPQSTQSLINGYKSQQPYASRPQASYTLRNISQQESNCLQTTREGFISFANFSKPGQDLLRSNKLSQISLGNSSSKTSSVQRSIGEQPNQNHQMLANKIITTTASNFNQTFSSKDMFQKIRGPPAFRQVTVRYL